MGRKIVQFHVSTVLTIMTLVPALFLLFLFILGGIVCLFVEMFKFYSRVSTSELTKYRVSRPIVEDSPTLRSKKIFKLPLPDDAGGNGVVMSPINEKKLSKVR